MNKLILLIGGVSLAAAQGCKTRSGASATLATGPGGDPSALPVDVAPLTGTQATMGTFAPGACFGGATATWTPAATVQFDSPELVPPGTLRLVGYDKAQSAFANWTRMAHPGLTGVDVLDARADSLDQLLDRFGSADPGAVNWSHARGFGPALKAALGGLPASANRYGVVVLRHVLSSQGLSGAAPAPQGADPTSQAYAQCGDSYLVGRVVADNYLVLIAAADAAKRDAATTAMREIALSRGDLDANLDAADRALSGNGGALMTLGTSGPALVLTTRGVGEAEAAINLWRSADGPTGVRSVLGAVQLYPAFQPPAPASSATAPGTAAPAAATSTGGTSLTDPAPAAVTPGGATPPAATAGGPAPTPVYQPVPVADLNQALKMLVVGGVAAATATGADKARLTTQVQALQQAVDDCAGNPFSGKCSNLRATVSAVPVAQIAEATASGATTFGIPDSYSDDGYCVQRNRHAPTRSEWLGLMTYPVFKQIIYNMIFQSRSTPDTNFISHGPGWDQKYGFVWVRNDTGDPTKNVAAQIEDKRTDWSDILTRTDRRNPNPFTDDYPFESTFAVTTGQVAEYRGFTVCIDTPLSP